MSSLQRKENAVDRLMRQMEEQSPENMLKGVSINVHYSTAAGSQELIIRKISEALADNLPFGLKCQRSQVIFIPSALKAYWLWGDGTTGPVFTYNDHQDLVNGVKMQYMVHKDFMTTTELVAMAKIVLYESALDNLASWRQQNLPESSEPAGQMGNGRS